MTEYMRLYAWRIRGDVSGGGWCKLSLRMTDAQARAWAAQAGVEIERVDSSVEVRSVNAGQAAPEPSDAPSPPGRGAAD